LASRRRRNLAAFAVVLLGLAVWFTYQRAHLVRDSFTAGYVLYGAVLFLAAYNLRKIFPAVVCFGSSATWMQWHIYVGLGSGFVFLWHIGCKIPNGVFETVLAALFATVFASGLLGLIWSRTIPRRLTAIGEQVIFEEIPLIRRRLVEQVYELLFQPAVSSRVLCRFYIQRLARFFECGRPLAYLIHPTGHTCRALVGELEGLDRYLSAEQREIGRQLVDYVRRKDDLDYHFALQGRLKVWLFVHIGLTYSLVAVATVHVVVVHAFCGSAA
jgi:hypothetical protein